MDNKNKDYGMIYEGLEKLKKIIEQQKNSNESKTVVNPISKKAS
jgi:hypothetical protein